MVLYEDRAWVRRRRCGIDDQPEMPTRISPQFCSYDCPCSLLKLLLPTQRPARFLEHLCGVRGRNLVGEGTFRVSSWSFQLAVQRSPTQASETTLGWHIVYTSEQVEANCNPDWAPFVWDAASARDLELLRTTTKIHVQVYAHSPALHCNPKRSIPGHVPYRHNQGMVSAPEAFNTSVVLNKARSANLVGSGQQHVTAAPAHQTAGDASETGSQDSSERDASGSSLQSDSHTTVTLTAQVSLNDLVAFQGSLATLDVCLPPNTLVLDLKEGFCLFPSLDIQADTLDQTVEASLPTSAAQQTYNSIPAEEPSQVKLCRAVHMRL